MAAMSDEQLGQSLLQEVRGMQCSGSDVARPAQHDRASNTLNHSDGLGDFFTSLDNRASRPGNEDSGEHRDLEHEVLEDNIPWRKRKRQLPKNAEAKSRAPPSKAATKRAKLAAKIGANNIGSDGEPKGIVREADNGQQDWWDETLEMWRPAAPHDTYRTELIERDSQNAPYLQPPEEGNDSRDITSRCGYLNQNTWDLEPEGWYEIVDSDGNRVMLLPQRPIRRELFPEPRYLLHRGLIMLDPDDHPVLDWPGLPLCFSSQLEGGRMEALRRVMPWLACKDFRARMPRQIRSSNGRCTPLPKASTFGQRRSRYRERTHCVAWTERTNTLDRPKLKTSEARGVDEATRVSDECREGSPSDDDTDVDSARRMPVRERGRSYLNESNASALPMIPTHQGPQQYQLPIPHQIAQSGTYSPVNVQANLNTHTAIPTFTPVDLRYLVPRSMQDRLNIKVALYITRADFRSRHLFEAPPTPDNESYHDQYVRIQEAHESRSLVHGPATELVGVEAFYDHFSNWRLPQCLDTARLLSVMGSLGDVGGINQAYGFNPLTMGIENGMNLPGLENFEGMPGPGL